MKNIILGLIGLMSFMSIQAKDTIPSYDPSEVKLNLNYVKGYYYDSKSIVKAPFAWNKKQWLGFGAFAATSALLYVGVDQRLKDWSQENKTDGSQKVANVVEVFGNGRYPVITTAAMYAIGAVLKKERPKRVALLILESYLLTGITTQGAKFLASRHRPWNDAPYNKWDGPKLKDVKTSFFSGHSSTAFAFATVFAMEYKEHKWVAPVAYGLAGVSALSRIHDNAHWASDVFIGSMIGYFMTRKIVKNHASDKLAGLSLSPSIGLNHTGLALNYKF